MPGIWESIRGQFESVLPVRNGRFSPGQAADLLLPGNWYNNREGRANPDGIAAGMIQGFTGMPAPLTERLIGATGGLGRMSGMFGGGDRPPPPRINAIRSAQNADRMAGVPRNENRIDIERDPSLEQRDPRVGQTEAPRGGGNQQRGTGLLGASQRFGSQVAFADMYEAQRRQMEQER